VLVVINKTDQNPAYDLNRQHLRAKYPAIKGFFKLSCADGSGIDSFKSALLKEIQQMENMRSLWSKTWFDVKNALQNMKENYITLQKYYAICRDNHLEDESQQKTLLEYLHDLGVILHFPEFDLKEFQVLEPKWITEAVYKIMNSHLLAIKKGYLEIQMLENILNKESFDKEEYRASLKNIRYTTREQQYIVALMKAFQLCYDVERGSGKLLVPDLLAVAEPVEVADFDKTVSLRFIYRFDYLPSSILSSFISNMNRDIKAPHLQWRTGVVLENKNIGASALVKADKENKEIYVYVNGEGKQDYFPVIRHTFSNIINSYQELLVEELVPLPGYENTTISYKELKGFEIAGIDDYFAGNLRKSFSVATLLKGIERPSETVGERRDGIQKYRVARNTPPPKGNLLLHLELQKIGSVEEMLLEPAHRLNVITGDNGLGKTFLLECAWWALSGQWAGLPAYPMEGIKPGDARLLYRVGGPDEPAPQIEASYDLKTRTWNPISPAPDTPSLLLYARIDGSFAVWDSSKTDSPDSPDAALSNDPFYRPLVFSKND
ncbi:MAG: AAA family ATPase, partial [bacterium]|nr:AAA family ATPase [bacterium]